MKTGYVQVSWVEEEGSFSDVLLKDIKLRAPVAHVSGRKRKGSGADVKPELAAADSKRPRAQVKPELIAVAMPGGATCALRKDMVTAFVEIAARNATRCQRRFNAARDYGKLDAEDARRKCYFWRELDRHSMFYLRAYFNLVNGLRSQESSAAARTPLLRCTASLGKLSDEEAEALVLAVIAFRYTNNMLGWVRYDQLRGTETQSVSEWKETLRTSLTAEKKAKMEQKPAAASTLAIMRAQRTSLLDSDDKHRADVDAPPAQALTATQILDYGNYVKARATDKELSKVFKVFTGQHQGRTYGQSR